VIVASVPPRPKHADAVGPDPKLSVEQTNHGASTDAVARPGTSTRLINIDNGGTLTDVCVIAGDEVLSTKTLTNAATWTTRRAASSAWIASEI
jgi:hypothetical protein